MQALGGPGENRTTARFGLAANGDDVGKELARFENIEERSCLLCLLHNKKALLSAISYRRSGIESISFRRLPDRLSPFFYLA